MTRLIFDFSSEIERHRGRIIILTYEGESPKETLFLVGKGVTYDTGGADIKAGGIMAGMSRDKCGAAAVAGFMKVSGYRGCQMRFQKVPKIPKFRNPKVTDFSKNSTFAKSLILLSLSSAP